MADKNRQFVSFRTHFLPAPLYRAPFFPASLYIFNIRAPKKVIKHEKQVFFFTPPHPSLPRESILRLLAKGCEPGKKKKLKA